MYFAPRSLIDVQGNILYTVEKEVDFADNVRQQNTPLAKLFRSAISAPNKYAKPHRRRRPSLFVPLRDVDPTRRTECPSYCRRWVASAILG